MIKEYIIKIDEDQSKKDIHGGFPLIEPPLVLIRCKDCRYYHGKNEECGARSFYPPSDDWYCADGEWREVK